MTRKAFFRSAIAALTLSCSAAAAAQPANSTTTGCRVRIDANATSWVIRGYDPFNGGAPTGTFDLTFSNEGDGECRFFPVFVLDREGFGLQTSSGPRIPYSLLDLFGQYDATPLGGRTVKNATRRAVVIAPHRQQIVRYLLTVPAEGIPGDGLFSQRISVEAEGTDGAPLGGRQLVLGVDVLPSAVMGLSGAFRRSNGQALVDLGELTEGLSAVPLQLHVRSTRGYRLGVESQNGGFLKLAGTGWSVPYQFIVNGRTVSLTGAGTYSAPVAAGMTRDTLPLAFHIGDVSDRRAGTYSDVITVSISVL